MNVVVECDPASQKDDVLRVPGFGDYRMEDIYLTKLVRVSRGSWQPVLQVLAPDALSAYSCSPPFR